VKKKLNLSLARDVFQPFAPTILEERIGDYLVDPHPNKFMTMSYYATEEFVKTAPAVVHVDGTTRPQTLEKEDNPVYYNIVKRFERGSGVGAVLNTSFNMHGEPIVCSPRDALNSFRKARLDVLVLEKFAVYL
ncbi:MAG TPA: carbamoyl transferase, partial [Thermococcus paralvinellae]|nr:carbamoyl transferase [Thermococcus paralvinellae]